MFIFAVSLSKALRKSRTVTTVSCFTLPLPSDPGATVSLWGPRCFPGGVSMAGAVLSSSVLVVLLRFLLLTQWFCLVTDTRWASSFCIVFTTAPFPLLWSSDFLFSTFLLIGSQV